MSDATTTERSRALFASAHQALLFAYTFSANQHAVTAAAERAIALHARERYAAAPHLSRGLGGLDGAAQAGMIKRGVDAMAAPYRQCIEARFAVLQVGVQVRAMRELVLFARRRLQPELFDLQLTCALVQRHYGARVSMLSLAAERSVTERTMRTRYRTVRDVLQAYDREAMRRVELALERAGICEVVA